MRELHSHVVLAVLLHGQKSTRGLNSPKVAAIATSSKKSSEAEFTTVMSEDYASATALWLEMNVTAMLLNDAK